MRQISPSADRAPASVRVAMGGFWNPCFVALALTASLMVANTAYAQTVQFTIEDKTLTTEDQVDIKITYYKATGGQASPVVILLHGKAGNRQNWKSVATVLQEKCGFAVITVDLRGHGDSHIKSTKKPDYRAMATNDLEAVKYFLFEEHQNKKLNMTKLGIVGCEFSAAVAMSYTEFDWSKEPFDDSPNFEDRTPRGQDVQALVLISPDATTPGLYPARTASALRGIDRLAVMIAASEKNSHDLAASKKLFDQISSKRVKSEQVSLIKYPEDVIGMNLVWQDDKLKEDLAQFLIKYVHDRDIKWEDRRSRFDRE
jgi:pimeloyl-ACP methyl ester carboxylesterase